MLNMRIPDPHRRLFPRLLGHGLRNRRGEVLAFLRRGHTDTALVSSWSAFRAGTIRVTAEVEHAPVNAAAAMSGDSVTVTGEGSSRRLLLSVAEQSR